jgi:hypothetical protein
VELEKIFGLPAHPLLVHAVVVLVPLAGIVGLVMVVSPRWRRSLALPAIVLAVAAAVSAQLAVGSGEELNGLVRKTALIRRHAGQGDLVTPMAVFLLAAIVGLVLADRWLIRETAPAGEGDPGASGASGGSSESRLPAWAPAWALRAAALAVVVASVASTGLVARAGHSGAKAVWKDSPSYLRKASD